MTGKWDFNFRNTADISRFSTLLTKFGFNKIIIYCSLSSINFDLAQHLV